VRFEVADGAEERVRLLEPLDSTCAYFHVTDDGRALCLDQDKQLNRIGADCPGCEAGSARKFITYAPVLWRGRLDLWEISSYPLQDALAEIEDLTARDIIIRRRGVGLETAYSIQPAAA
jgi:hypothetical protein